MKMNEIMEKNAQNDAFWATHHKIPYFALIIMSLIFIILIILQFTNVYRLLYGAIIPCSFALLMAFKSSRV